MAYKGECSAYLEKKIASGTLNPPHDEVKSIKLESTDTLKCSWDLEVELSGQVLCERSVVANVIRLLDQDNTIPFIARYRQEQTKSMGPEKLREVKEKLEELREVEAKAVAAVRKIEKLGKLDEKIKSSLLGSRTTEEVEHLFTPFKVTAKKTLADRARELGLETFALQMLSNSGAINLSRAVDPRKEGLSSVSEVEVGVQHIIADIIAKDHRTMEFIRNIIKTSRILLHSTKRKTKAKNEKETKVKNKSKAKDSDAEKYELYYAFSCDVRHIQPHKVLAINRGESRKMLSVRVEIPNYVSDRFLDFCKGTFLPKGYDQTRFKVIVCSAEDAYKRLIEPLMARTVRQNLNKTAEKASISVFAANLKRLLLIPPVRGQSVLGIDPGFFHGCKYALVSALGKIEETGVAYLHGQRNGINVRVEEDKLKNVLIKHRCETVAIGNGVGCRETELFFSIQIKRGTFEPLKVVFSIVSEAGASIYSASEEANKEMPHLDISVRGAVSIARRLQDPLAELVKIDPKNIGVGMYQHDVTEKNLKASLDGVVEECVSFVGVDVNVASETLLRHIAGINSGTAKKITEHRNSRGPFQNRSQLMAVSGLGPKTFEQCAGFLRILPETRTVLHEPDLLTEPKGKKRSAAKTEGPQKRKKMKTEINSDPNALDMTAIHPESYHIADRLVSAARLNRTEIGSGKFLQMLQTFLRSNDVDSLAVEFQTTTSVLKQIIGALSQRIDQDLRDDYEKPLFRSSVRSISDLKVGSVVSGKVTNVTHFGAFVDIGVGTDGLIYFNQASGSQSSLQLGNLVETCVKSLDLERGRISLTLFKVTG